MDRSRGTFADVACNMDSFGVWIGNALKRWR